LALSSKQELFCWLTGTSLAIALFARSHTFYVTTATYCYGLALLLVMGISVLVAVQEKPGSSPPVAESYC